MKLTSIDDLAGKSKKDIQALVAEWSISDLFEKHLGDIDDEKDFREPGIHASELNTCKRMVVYSLYGTRKVKKVPRDMKKRFMVGHALHDMLQSEFYKMVKKKGGEVTFEKEVKTKDTKLGRQLDIHSSCDGVFTFWKKENGLLVPFLRVGLEIKTEAPDSYAALKAPRPKHVEQTHVYMACLDIPITWFMYWNKGNQNYTPMKHPWMVPFDPSIWKKLEDRARDCLHSAEQEELPDREEGFHCTWCPYAYVCKGAPTGGRNTHLRSLRR